MKPPRRRGGGPAHGKAVPRQPTRNLHVSQFGQGTTREHVAQIFSQYAEVREVIMREGWDYCFVNTASVEAASRARESLTGHNLMGGTLRINFAGGNSSVARETRAHCPACNFRVNQTAGRGLDLSAARRLLHHMKSTTDVEHQELRAKTPPSVSLFVRGYGPTTTEDDLWRLFGDKVTAVRMKEHAPGAIPLTNNPRYHLGSCSFRGMPSSICKRLRMRRVRW